MDSVTKAKVTENQIRQLVQNTFGNQHSSYQIEELKDGYFNLAYLITFQDAFKTVLKIAPSPSIQLMRYEKDIMKAEVEVLNRIKAYTEVLVPKVLDYNSKGNIIENEYFFMEYIDGVPLNKLSEKLTSLEADSIYEQLGAFTKQINSIRGDSFGYIVQEDRKFHTWGEAFIRIIKDVLEDGEDAGVLLPVGYDEIYKTVSVKKDILNLVTKPSLLHKDLWAGNIFVNPETLKITGVVDCERAIWGDPILDFVFGFVEDNTAFNNGYGRKKAETTEERCRKSLYSLYLYLILVIECKYRFYPTDDQEKWGRSALENELKVLNEF